MSPAESRRVQTSPDEFQGKSTSLDRFFNIWWKNTLYYQIPRWVQASPGELDERTSFCPKCPALRPRAERFLHFWYKWDTLMYSCKLMRRPKVNSLPHKLAHTWRINTSMCNKMIIYDLSFIWNVKSIAFSKPVDTLSSQPWTNISNVNEFDWQDDCCECLLTGN